MKACRTGRLNFYPPSCIHSQHCFAFKLRDAVRHMSSPFSFMHFASQVKENWLWFSNWDSCLNHFVCLLVVNFQYLFRQTQRKPGNTVYLSTPTNFLWYLTFMQTLFLCVQTIFVSWLTRWRKITAYLSCCNAKVCFCSFSIRSNLKQFPWLIDWTC